MDEFDTLRWKSEVAWLFVLHLLGPENDRHWTAPLEHEVPFEIERGQITRAHRCHEKYFDGNRGLRFQRAPVRLCVARGRFHQSLRQPKQGTPLAVIVELPQPGAVF